MTKLNESVKNIEKNFDSALDFEAKSIIDESRVMEQSFGSELDSGKSPLAAAESSLTEHSATTQSFEMQNLSFEMMKIASISSFHGKPVQLPDWK